MLKLRSRTPPAWAARAAAHLDDVMLDHAHCEKKAAGVAMTLIFQSADRPGWMAPLAALAREELAHFDEVLRWLERRHVAFGRQRPSPYAGRLREIVRQPEAQRRLDTLLCSAVIEARSCERLGLLADAVVDPELAHFYRGLRSAEARHHGVYLDLACQWAGRDQVAARLDDVVHHEAAVLADAPTEPRLHNA